MGPAVTGSPAHQPTSPPAHQPPSPGLPNPSQWKFGCERRASRGRANRANKHRERDRRKSALTHRVTGHLQVSFRRQAVKENNWVSGFRAQPPSSPGQAPPCTECADSPRFIGPSLCVIGIVIVIAAVRCYQCELSSEQGLIKERGGRGRRRGRGRELFVKIHKCWQYNL